MADVITRFKLETTQYDSKLRDASKGLADIVRQASLAGNEFGKFTQKSVESARALGNIQTSSSNAKDKVKELVGAFNDVARQYNVLTKEQQQSDFGKALAESMIKLKGRIGEAKQEMMSMGSAMSSGGGIGGGLGNLNGLLGQFGSQLGINTSLLSSFSAGSLTAATGVGAAAMAIGAATKALADYNRELARQDQITSVTTGLKGADADKMTDAARSISKVYGTDFREVINAANVLMTQFGQSGDDAIQLIKRGMQGMIQGDGPKLLQLIQQYAPSFRDAGIEASQLVAIIQNSEGGLFTAENMNAIVMGIKNVRLMKDTTKKALQEIGVDAEAMSQKLNDGTMTVFDALKEISSQLENVGSGSQAAGQVMQDIFGRQGTAAGTNLAKAIANLNLNLEETAIQTGEIGKAMAELEVATNNLENSLRDTFEVDNIDTMATKIETQLTKDLTELISLLGELKTIFMSAFGTETVSAIGTVLEGVWGLTKEVLYLGTGVLELYRVIKAFTGIEIGGGGGSGWVDKMKQTITEHMTNPQSVLPEVVVYPRTSRTTGGGGHRGRGGGGGNKTPKTEEQLNNEQIAKLTREFEKASEDRRKAIQEEIKALQDRNFEIKTYQDLATGKVKERSPLEQGEGAMSITDSFMRDVETALKSPAAIAPDSIITPLQQMEEELQRLIELRDRAFTSEGWQLGNYSVQQQQQRIANYKGEGKDKDKKEEKSVSQGVSQLAGSMNQMVSGMEQLGMEIPDDIKGVVSGIQGVTTILTGIASIVSAIEVIVGATSFIPGLAGGGVIHAATGVNVVPGNHTSGDMVPAMLNSGEVVLNRAQTNNIASILEGGGTQRVTVEGVISGENIRLAMRNNGLRSGRGEYVTTRRM